MVTASGCELVIAQAEHAQLLREGQAPDLVLLDEHAAAVDAAPATPTGTRPRPADPAYVIYTSGSTGTPKGVLVHHGGLANYLLWTVEEYAARGTGGSPFFTSISFDLQVPSLYAPLLSGQCVNLLPDPLPTADLGALLVAGAPYSFVKLTPGHLNLLSLDLDAEQARDLAGLVIAAGDSFPTALARRWQELAGPQGTAVATEYGPTEITVGNSGQVIGAPDGEGLVPLGAPIPNTTMYVLDERLEPVPEGVAGEVCIGGAGVAHGYLGDAALTAERFVPDPWGSPGSRLYRTGDRARWNAGGWNSWAAPTTSSRSGATGWRSARSARRCAATRTSARRSWSPTNGRPAPLASPRSSYPPRTGRSTCPACVPTSPANCPST